jgi:lipopolysaccharide/colanic/teichoic acid biosynthesis glycosyltransferase
MQQIGEWKGRVSMGSSALSVEEGEEIGRARKGNGARPISAHPPGAALAHRTEPALPERRLLGQLLIRSIDIAVAGSVLLVTAPLMILIAILIKLDSPGPALFRHLRIGENRRRGDAHPGAGPNKRGEDLFGKPFMLYKFRSMYADARQRFPELYAYDYDAHELHSMPIKVLVSTKNPATDRQQQPASALLADPRLTRVGRWLRRTSLDELPNLVNVLLGDMHLVGPRPDIVENIRYYEKQHLAKLDVRPGVTGLAQVQGRGNLSFHETNEWDVEYVRNRSVWLDLKILWKTLWVSLRGDGAF